MFVIFVLQFLCCWLTGHELSYLLPTPHPWVPLCHPGCPPYCPGGLLLPTPLSQCETPSYSLLCTLKQCALHSHFAAELLCPPIHCPCSAKAHGISMSLLIPAYWWPTLAYYTVHHCGPLHTGGPPLHTIQYIIVDPCILVAHPCILYSTSLWTPAYWWPTLAYYTVHHCGPLHTGGPPLHTIQYIIVDPCILVAHPCILYSTSLWTPAYWWPTLAYYTVHHCGPLHTGGPPLHTIQYIIVDPCILVAHPCILYSTSLWTPAYWWPTLAYYTVHHCGPLHTGGPPLHTIQYIIVDPCILVVHPCILYSTSLWIPAYWWPTLAYYTVHHCGPLHTGGPPLHTIQYIIVDPCILVAHPCILYSTSLWTPAYWWPTLAYYTVHHCGSLHTGGPPLHTIQYIIVDPCILVVHPCILYSTSLWTPAYWWPTLAYYTVHLCGPLHTKLVHFCGPLHTIIVLYISASRCTQWPRMVP